MNLRKHLLEAITLVVAAALCATVANALASRERKVAWVGSYTNTTSVPAKTPEPAPRIVEPTVTTPPLAQSPIPSTTTTAAPTTTAPTTDNRQPTTTQVPPTKKPVPPPAPKQDDVLTRFPPHEKEPYVEIHGDDVAWLHGKGVLFLDARRTSVYQDGHIAGARPFSVWESDVDDKVAKLFDERGDPKQQLQPIVVYCSGGDCEDSHMLAKKLWGAQFNNVYVYKDGFPDWQKRGGAIHQGPTP